MTLEHRSKFQLADCKQDSLKSHCVPWRGMSYDSDSIVSDMITYEWWTVKDLKGNSSVLVRVIWLLLRGKLRKTATQIS